MARSMLKTTFNDRDNTFIPAKISMMCCYGSNRRDYETTSINKNEKTTTWRKNTQNNRKEQFFRDHTKYFKTYFIYQYWPNCRKYKQQLSAKRIPECWSFSCSNNIVSMFDIQNTIIHVIVKIWERDKNADRKRLKKQEFCI